MIRVAPTVLVPARTPPPLRVVRIESAIKPVTFSVPALNVPAVIVSVPPEKFAFPVIALALLCGQRGAPYGRRALWLVPLAWFAGGLFGLFVGNNHGAALTWVSFLLLGGLVAANARISLRLLTALAALFGCFHGYLDGAGINRFDDGGYALLGLSLAVFVVVALFASLVVPLRQQWARVAVRVAGSWIAASGLLMLGWALHAAHY